MFAHQYYTEVNEKRPSVTRFLHYESLNLYSEILTGKSSYLRGTRILIFKHAITLTSRCNVKSTG